MCVVGVDAVEDVLHFFHIEVSEPLPDHDREIVSSPRMLPFPASARLVHRATRCDLL